MLHAIHKGKTHSLSSFSGMHRGSAQWQAASEDTFTAMVFGRLCYLPATLFWEILTAAIYQPPPSSVIFGYQPGAIVSYEFWPHWLPHGTSNTSFVEPDAFIQTEFAHLIIEAKRWDYATLQHSTQWEDQYHAYLNTIGQTAYPLLYLAIGGIPAGTESSEQRTIFKNGVSYSFRVWKARWQSLLRSIEHTHRRLRAAQDFSPAYHILSDLLTIFAMHSFKPLHWLDELPAVWAEESLGLNGEPIFSQEFPLR